MQSIEATAGDRWLPAMLGNRPGLQSVSLRWVTTGGRHALACHQ